ncbi:MAG TPA: helix-turn-helix domain-containing protein [Gemmataceae bacterium]
MSVGAAVRESHGGRAARPRPLASSVMLAETTLSLDQIAQRAGYKHTQNRVELFKKKFGQTPGAYRRAVQG